jgi:hypothetical protein
MVNSDAYRIGNLDRGFSSSIPLRFGSTHSPGTIEMSTFDQIARDMREGTFPKKSEKTLSEEYEALERRIAAMIDEKAIVDAAGIKNANDIARDIVRMFKRSVPRT